MSQIILLIFIKTLSNIFKNKQERQECYHEKQQGINCDPYLSACLMFVYVNFFWNEIGECKRQFSWFCQKVVSAKW